MMGTSKGGDLLVGKADWVKARVSNRWRGGAARAPRSSPWGRIATALDARPFFLVASKAAPELITTLTKDLGDNFGRDLLVNHKVAVLSATATGLTWMYDAKDAAFARRMETASKGLIDLMRAAHLAPRGMAQVAVAALPSYARMSKELDAVVAARDQVMAAVWDLTGDGKFSARVRVDGTLVTTVATGKKFTDVVPASFVVGLGAIGFLTSGRAMDDKAPAMAHPPARAVPPRKGGGLGTPVKPRPKPRTR
jgi:hypothetical protein